MRETAGRGIANGGLGALRKDFVTVRECDSLLDAARAHRAGRPMAVVDEEGRLTGTLAADRILAGIAAAPSHPAGGLHA